MSMDPRALWSRLKKDPQGLVTAVVQDDQTYQVLMVGHMNEEALAATSDRQRVCFWSRSRGTLWEKGETSGNSLHLRSMRVDCDGDALLLLAHPVGPTCHTGATSCFFQRFSGDNPHALPTDDGPPPLGDTMLDRVFDVILERKAGRGATNADGKSYVRSLLDRGIPKISAKIREETEELCQALADETDDRVVSEAADLLFHIMVGMTARDLHLRDVGAVFAKRFGTSGVDEKASRNGGPSNHGTA